MTLIQWPKLIKLDDVVNALDDLNDRVNANTARLDALAATQQGRLAELEHFAAEHQAGAAERQREVDRLAAEANKLRFALRTGRKP